MPLARWPYHGGDVELQLQATSLAAASAPYLVALNWHFAVRRFGARERQRLHIVEARCSHMQAVLTAS